MKVWNVSGWNIEGKSAGENYLIPAFGEVDVYDLYHANHLLRHYKDEGLVSLEYGPLMKAKYTTFEEYKQAQEIDGLRTLLLRWERVLLDEEQYMKDVVKKGGSEKDKSVSNIDIFEQKVKLIKKWLKEAGYSETKELKAEEDKMKRPNWRLKDDTTGTGN